jgi:hypothetical protein
MSEIPPSLSDDKADHFWNRKRIGLVVLAILLVLILVLAILVSLGPTICCTIFSNVMNSL